jgi:riboflavin kinase / FMN adenylyltransferase
VIRGVKALPEPLAESVVTIGAFDGVHRGHQALLERATAKARALDIPAIAYTFDPHPAKLLAPKVAPHMLTSVRERVRLMRMHGIDEVIVEPFDRAFAELTADAWVDDFLVAWLHPKHVVVGFNFSYGKNRGGDPDHLRRAGQKHGFTVDVVQPVVVSTMIVSSTRVREFLLEGNLEGASLLLGRNFALTGLIVRGQERGRTIGIPTANLESEAEILPANGVYATRVVVEPSDDPKPEPARDAVTNIGVRPTFQGTSVSVESHLLDFDGDLYGKRVRVELVARIRDERRFEGVEALKQQVVADIAEARRILAGSNRP